MVNLVFNNHALIWKFCESRTQYKHTSFNLWVKMHIMRKMNKTNYMAHLLVKEWEITWTYVNSSHDHEYLSILLTQHHIAGHSIPEPGLNDFFQNNFFYPEWIPNNGLMCVYFKIKTITSRKQTFQCMFYGKKILFPFNQNYHLTSVLAYKTHCYKFRPGLDKLLHNTYRWRTYVKWIKLLLYMHKLIYRGSFIWLLQKLT